MATPNAASAARWCEVRVGDRVMRYRRSGGGYPVLVLRAMEEAGALWPGLAGALASGFRVLEPQVPADAWDATAWLADLIEGLGVVNVTLVAAGGLCVPALEYVLRHGDLASRLVLVPPGRTERTSGLHGSLATSARELPVPLLMVRRGHPEADAIRLITRFLARPEP